ERDGGGIYVVSVLGGAARLIARQGRQPRFSPDGRNIAYWVGDFGEDSAAPGVTKIFVVPASGGEPRELRPDFASAQGPIWSPDGKKILFVGVREPTAMLPSQERIFEAVDWWVTPLDGGPAVKTGASAVFVAKGIQRRWLPNTWIFEGNEVVFSATSGDG